MLTLIVCRRRFVERYFRSEFSDSGKIWHVHDDSSARPIIRSLANCSPAMISWRQDRGYLIADRVEYDAVNHRLAVLFDFLLRIF